MAQGDGNVNDVIFPILVVCNQDDLVVGEAARAMEDFCSKIRCSVAHAVLKNSSVWQRRLHTDLTLGKRH